MGIFIGWSLLVVRCSREGAVTWRRALVIEDIVMMIPESYDGRKDVQGGTKVPEM
jgi:hypothetical protein